MYVSVTTRDPLITHWHNPKAKFANQHAPPKALRPPAGRPIALQNSSPLRVQEGSARGVCHCDVNVNANAITIADAVAVAVAVAWSGRSDGRLIHLHSARPVRVPERGGGRCKEGLPQNRISHSEGEETRQTFGHAGGAVHFFNGWGTRQQGGLKGCCRRTSQGEEKTSKDGLREFQYILARKQIHGSS